MAKAKTRILRSEEAILEDWKRNETIQEVAILAGNRPSMRIILCWDKITIREYPKPEVPENDKLIKLPEWKQLWYYKDVDMEEIALMAQLPLSKVQSHVLQAKANHWVYPDGTVHKYALQLSQGMAMKIMQNINSGFRKKKPIIESENASDKS